MADTNDFEVPLVDWPFPFENHPDAVELDKRVDEWLQPYLDAGKCSDRLSDLKLAFASTLVWSYGSFERSLVVCKYNALFYIIDDMIDTQEGVNKFATRLIEICRKNEHVPIDEEHWLEAAFSDMWRTLSGLAHEKWTKRVIEHLQIWFYVAPTELKFRKSKIVPSLNEYLHVRVWTIGLETCFDLNEFCHEEYLNDEQRGNRILHSLLYHCRCVMFVTNDLYSIRKEMKKGDVMNLILVLQKEHKITLQKAVDKAVEFFYTHIELYNRGKEMIRNLHGTEFDVYLHGVERMMRGHFDYFFLSKRYVLD